MKYIFLVEEKSMKKFLDVLLHERFPENVTFRVISHDGKGDLKKSVKSKLRALNGNDVKFVILIDQDSSNCRVLKEEIRSLCENTEADYKIRIVCRELESWYLGNLTAVDNAFSTKLAKHGKNEKFRQPDNIDYAKQILKKYIGEIGQIETAEKIATAMKETNLHDNKSYSFGVFLKTIGLVQS